VTHIGLSQVSSVLEPLKAYRLLYVPQGLIFKKNSTFCPHIVRLRMCLYLTQVYHKSTHSLNHWKPTGYYMYH